MSSVKGHVKGERHTIETDVASIPVLHLWGSPFEMGFARGVLMGSEILVLLAKTEEYMMNWYKEECLDEFIWLPETFLHECAKQKLDRDFEELRDQTWDYIR